MDWNEIHNIIPEHKNIRVSVPTMIRSWPQQPRWFPSKMNVNFNFRFFMHRQIKSKRTQIEIIRH